MAEARACRLRNNRKHERRDNDKPYHTQLREQLQIVIVRIIDAKRGHGEIELFEGHLVAAQAAAENRIRLDKMHGVFPYQGPACERDFLIRVDLWKPLNQRIRCEKD